MNGFENKRDEQQRRILAFAAAMVDRLDEKASNPDKGFLTWELDEINSTFAHLASEVGELATTLYKSELETSFIECVDVACMAFILGDLIVQETEES
ncbi:hypothetical protein LCGC14_1971300 [marine sediment metagenome]|uniref:Uncharacterized protein n=1 Tax=marine sediment metagenome TaxID=412755 RepID=A0A0F9FBT9_9ZZZZ